MALLELQNVYKQFHSEHVLRGVTHSIEKGTITAIIGPSGSGKSTLLRLLNQLEDVTDGQIFFDGEDISKSDVNINWLRQHIQMVFQSFHLFQNKTVLENCTIGQRVVLSRSKDESNTIATTHLSQLGLLEFIHKKSTELSGGQKQRVAIARALSMQPDVLLFDEPTSALDPEMVRDVKEAIKTIIHPNLTIVIVTHEMQFAHEIADEILFMDQGTIVDHIDASDLYNKDKTSLRLQQFLQTI